MLKTWDIKSYCESHKYGKTEKAVRNKVAVMKNTRNYEKQSHNYKKMLMWDMKSLQETKLQ